MSAPIDRRTFLRSMAAGGGSLVLGLWVSACTDETPEATTTTGQTATTTLPPSSTTTTTPPAVDPDAQFVPDILLRVGGDETVTVTVPKSEMGQGVRTSLAMLVAEELDADWDLVRVETADADRSYGDQTTGGSTSISSRFNSMRRVGAAARQMLIAAAAATWKVDPSACTTEPGAVVEKSGTRRATFGSLVEKAAAVDPPSPGEIELKPPDQFRIVGQPLPAVDAEAITRGTAVYSSDVARSGMVHAVVARPPVLGSRVSSFDDTAARAVAGVIDVVELASGVAVVGSNTWAAMQGREALHVDWDQGPDAPPDDASILADLTSQLTPATVGGGEITADYTYPFFPHAAIEPLVCTAMMTDDGLEVWAGTQDAQLARAIAGTGASIPSDQVTLHVPLIGGGFGRRLEHDFVRETAQLAAAIGGPVKVQWSRDDDLRHDRFQPAGISRAIGDPARPADVRIETELARSTKVPTAPWRAVTNVPEAFARESFLDELSSAAGRDPYQYRRDLLDERALATLDAVAEAAGWGDSLPDGSGRGIAYHATWGVTPTALVVEVSVVEKTIRLDRAFYAIDCGVVVNPDMVRAQMEGGFAFGATAALLGGVTITGGAVVEENFTDAPILRYDEMPPVEVIIIPSDAVPSGVGEAPIPPVAPAIANAVFAATGVRLRDLPLQL